MIIIYNKNNLLLPTSFVHDMIIYFAKTTFPAKFCFIPALSLGLHVHTTFLFLTTVLHSFINHHMAAYPCMHQRWYKLELAHKTSPLSFSFDLKVTKVGSNELAVFF